MSADTGLEVKVVFDAASRGRRRGKAVSVVRRRSRPTLWVYLGVLNLVAAGAAYYITWWKADPFIYMTLIWHTPIPGLSLGAVDTAFANAPGAPLDGSTADNSLSSNNKTQGPTIVGMRATEVIGVTTVAWLTIASLCTTALALAGGSLLGRAGGTALRRAGVVLLVGFVVLLGYAAFQTLSEYGRHYPPRHLRIGMGGLTLIALLLGMAVGDRTRGFCRMAGAATILAGMSTVAALYLGHLCGSIEPEWVTPTFLGLTFAAVSAWGWVVYPLGTRWAR